MLIQLCVQSRRSLNNILHLVYSPPRPVHSLRIDCWFIFPRSILDWPISVRDCISCSSLFFDPVLLHMMICLSSEISLPRPVRLLLRIGWFAFPFEVLDGSIPILDVFLFHHLQSDRSWYSSRCGPTLFAQSGPSVASHCASILCR